MHILVANGTHHVQDFQFRVPTFDKVLNIVIQPGRQAQLPVDMDETQVGAVIKQLERYGARPASDVDSIDSPRGMIYSVNRPVKSEQIDAAREKDEAIRQKISDTEVEHAGEALFSPAVSEHLNEASLKVQELETNAGPADPTKARPVKGGVDTEVTVSTRARGRSRGRT